MNKTLAITLCCIAFAVALERAPGPVENESKYTIDQATDILNGLLADAHQNLEDENHNWDTNKPIMEKNISNLTELLNKKTQQCQDLTDTLHGHQTDLENAHKYAEWLEKRITENTDRIAQILSERCTQNGIYIEGLKNDKIALKLVDFLRTQIQNKESFDFAQHKVFMKNLKSFLFVYQTGDFAALVELEKQLASDYTVDVDESVKGRTSDEIGVRHIDNDKQELDLDEFQNGPRKSWADIKIELLEILDGLQTTIKDKMQKAQDDEIKSSTSAAEFKLQLEHEIQVYKRELAKEEEVIRNLDNTVAQDQNNVDQCHHEQNDISGQKQDAEKELENAHNTHNRKQKDLEEEVSIFNEVLNLYLPSTGSQGKEFKERADDYLDDNTFDNSDYNDREVPDIELLNHDNDDNGDN